MTPSMWKTRHPALSYRNWDFILVQDKHYGWVWLRRLAAGWLREDGR